MRIIGDRGAAVVKPLKILWRVSSILMTWASEAVQFDVRQLKYNELIIMHDDNWSRTTGADQALYELNSQQL